MTLAVVKTALPTDSPYQAKSMVSIDAVTMSFGAYVAVQNVNLNVADGEFVAIVGPTGCGKSTILNAIAGLLKPSTGTVAIDGQPVRGVQNDIGYLFQQDALLPWKTALENVELGPMFKGTGAAERREQSMKWLAKVGLKGFEHRYPHQLSGGQQQRAVIARALVLDPKVVVCDEPVSALDVSVQAQIINLLNDLKARFGMGYLFISHDLGVVRHISDRIAVMQRGVIVETGRTAEIFANPRHDYTRSLLAAVPAATPAERRARRIA